MKRPLLITLVSLIIANPVIVHGIERSDNDPRVENSKQLIQQCPSEETTGLLIIGEEIPPVDLLEGANLSDKKCFINGVDEDGEEIQVSGYLITGERRKLPRLGIKLRKLGFDAVLVYLGENKKG